MKSNELRKIEAINRRNPTTISQWQRSKTEYIALTQLLKSPELSPGFNLGHLMPVIEGNFDHLVPAGKAYLFTKHPARFQKVIDKNHESSCRNGKWRTISSAKHILHVVSVAVFGERKLEWMRGPSDVVKSFILPPGWQWKKDDLGIFVIDPSGVDYHPRWTSNITVNDILTGHSENKSYREKQIQSVLFTEKLQESLHNTYVTLDDSRRAGNCIEGSLAFAERILHLDRAEILAGSFWLDHSCSMSRQSTFIIKILVQKQHVCKHFFEKLPFQFNQENKIIT